MLATMMLLGAQGCRSEARDLTDTATVTLGNRELTVTVADSMEEQARGLSNTPRPDDSAGMLFVWDDAGPRAFTISSVRYDLDVIFIGEDGRVNQVLALSPDGPERVQGSYPSRYVLEVRGGWAERYGIETGSEFSVGGGGL